MYFPVETLQIYLAKKNALVHNCVRLDIHMITFIAIELNYMSIILNEIQTFNYCCTTIPLCRESSAILEYEKWKKTINHLFYLNKPQMVIFSQSFDHLNS